MAENAIANPATASQNGNSHLVTTTIHDHLLLPDLFDQVPVALYTCDAHGRITMFNQAATELWGRSPEIGKDHWCGSWKIYHTDGITPMAFDQCPMAITLREKREVNDREIVIQRPDGIFRHIHPHPKPLFDHEGNLVGALNMLVDITDQKATEAKVAMLAAIVRSSEDAIVSKSLQGIVTSWNNSAERIFGFRADEMIGLPITKIIPEERLDEEPKLLDKLRKGERVEHFETQRRTKSGKIRDISLSVSPVLDKAGNIIGASKIARDITDLKAKELMVKTISKFSPVGMWMTDPHAENIFVNETWIEWTGQPLEKQLGKGWMEFIHEEDRTDISNKFKEALENRDKFSAEIRIVGNDDTLRWCLTEGAPYFTNNGEFAGYAGSVTDITEIKKLEERKDDFIKMASHELKTPITSIKGYVQLLQTIYDESNEDKFQLSRPTVKASLHTISKQVNRLTRLISELLDLSRIQSGRLELHKKEFDLGDLIEEAAHDARHSTAKHAIIIHNEFQGTIYGDKDRISQVLLNLLTNAIKYSPDADSVEITVYNEKDKAIIKVKDFGIGIDPADQPYIFERFYRVEGKSEQTFPGFGIGLFIAQEIAQRHMGNISVESKKGKGSEFSLTLPLGTKSHLR